MLTLRARRDAFDDGDDGDLCRALAASLGEHSHQTWAPQQAAAAGAGLEEDDDAALARAIAASREEEPAAVRRKFEDEASKGGTPVAEPSGADIAITGGAATDAAGTDDVLTVVPEEPAADAAGVVTLAFRLPSGGRVTRRFVQSDTLDHLAHVLRRVAGVAMDKHRLAHGYPPTVLEPGSKTLAEAGLVDKSVINVL
jgi:ataxin-3